MMKYDKSMFKRFISYYKDYKLLFSADLAAAFILAAIELVYPYATTVIMDDYIPNGQTDKLLYMIAALVGLYIIMAGLNYFMHYWGHVLGIRMEANMRSDFSATCRRCSSSSLTTTEPESS